MDLIKELKMAALSRLEKPSVFCRTYRSEIEASKVAIIVSEMALAYFGAHKTPRWIVVHLPCVQKYVVAFDLTEFNTRVKLKRGDVHYFQRMGFFNF